MENIEDKSPDDTSSREKIDPLIIEKDIEKRISRLPSNKQRALYTAIAAVTSATLFLSACREINNLLPVNAETLPRIVVTVSTPQPEQTPVYVQDQAEINMERLFPPDLEFQGETNQLSEEASLIIEGVRNDYGVQFISPRYWEGLPNEVWGENEIAAVAEAISSLPPQYHNNNSRSPREILLLRGANSLSQGAGGGYANRQLILLTPSNFAPYENLRDEAGRLYGNQRNQLRATVVHEWTHSFTEAHPELVEDWITQTGWEQGAQGNWHKINPNNELSDGNADKFPVEDIAVSAAILVVNPTSLPEDRINFFLESSFYQDLWGLEELR